MSGLNDNHRRRILTSLQYADKLLQENLRALLPGARPLFAGCIQDLSPAKVRLVESYARKIREQMSKLLAQCGIQPPPPSAYASGKLRTGITSLDLTLEDIYPEKMRGYGKMDAAAAHDLLSTLQEIRRFVSPLLALLSQPEPGVFCGLDSRPELSALVQRLAQIISDYGLVEFLPALNAIARAAASVPEAARIHTASRQAEALRKVLLMTLKKPGPSSGAPEPAASVELQIRQFDETIAAFRHRWKQRIGNVPAWSKEALDAVASRLALEPSGRDFAPAEVADAVADAVNAQGAALQSEYAQLTGPIQKGLAELEESDPIVSILAREHPVPAGVSLPPVSMPAAPAVPISGQRGRGGAAARTRHIRAELQDKLGAAVEKMVQELLAGLEPWFRNTMESLEESVRSQTDPLRSGSCPDPAVPDEKRKMDIAFLENAGTRDREPSH
jgi:hypothetical protein